MDNFLFDMASAAAGLLGIIFKALSPLIIGLVIAYLLSPVVNWFEERIKNRGFSIIITYGLAATGLFGLLYGFVVLIIGALPSDGIDYTIKMIFAYFEDAVSAINDFAAKHITPVMGEKTDAESAIKSLTSNLVSRFSLSSLLNALYAVTGGIVSFFIGAVASVYLLKDKDFFIRLWEDLLVLTLKQKSHGIISETMSQINSVISTFIKGALVDSLIVAFLSSLVLTLLEVKFAVIIGVIGGLLNIIPYFGPFFGMVPAFLVAFFDAGLAQSLLVILGLFLVQQLDSNIIYPKIVGATTGLHPLFVLMAVSIFGYFFGIAGMLLAVPVAGIIQVLIKNWVYSRQ